MSVERTIHVVAFDVPFPPDYGGVIDVYYRCRQLKEAGYKVLLHCYEYGRGQQHEYTQIASEVFYYKRYRRLSDWFSPLPFIVKTRRHTRLLQRLLKDEHPILFEGQHTTFFLNHPELRDRKKAVRQHNVEWQYYEGLANRTASLWKRWYYSSESRKLQHQEQQLGHADLIACISAHDHQYYRALFPQSEWLPVAFDQATTTVAQPKRPPYFLFHGNLSVAENKEAVLWLLTHFPFSSTPHELVIAGKNPCKELVNQCKMAGATLIANPDEATMHSLIQHTEAHLLIGFQQSGIKLKLLYALKSGKPCIATPEMVDGSGLEKWCTVIQNESALQEVLLHTMSLPESARAERLHALRSLFSEKTLLDLVERYLYS